MSASPGPWVLEPDTYAREGCTLMNVTIRDATGAMVVEAVSWEGDASVEAKPDDARLLAAAPELLAMLKRVAAELDTWAHPPLLDEAEALIRRIEGG